MCPKSVHHYFCAYNFLEVRNYCIYHEQVRAGVEQQVNYAMARATELEAILERTRQSHSEQLKQERAAFQIVEGELEASTKLSCRLQQDLEECKEELAGCEFAEEYTYFTLPL
jgi:hypothetical protein